MTPSKIANVVANAFGRSVRSLYRSTKARRTDPARQVFVYMLVQYLPRRERYPARNGSTRAAGAQDGNTKPVARLMGLHPSGVSYMLSRVEDRREDPVFDARLSEIERVLAS